MWFLPVRVPAPFRCVGPSPRDLDELAAKAADFIQRELQVFLFVGY